jgi:hypothetical protein
MKKTQILLSKPIKLSALREPKHDFVSRQFLPLVDNDSPTTTAMESLFAPTCMTLHQKKFKNCPPKAKIWQLGN